MLFSPQKIKLVETEKNKRSEADRSEARYVSYIKMNNKEYQDNTLIVAEDKLNFLPYLLSECITHYLQRAS